MSRADIDVDIDVDIDIDVETRSAKRGNNTMLRTLNLFFA